MLKALMMEDQTIREANKVDEAREVAEVERLTGVLTNKKNSVQLPGVLIQLDNGTMAFHVTGTNGTVRILQEGSIETNGGRGKY